MKDIPSLILFFIEIAWRRRYLIVLPLLIFPVLALIAGRMTPRTYEAQTTILVQETAKLNPFLNDLAVGPNLQERMPALQTLVHSEHILESVLMDTGKLDAQSTAAQKAWEISRLSAAITVQMKGTDLVAFRMRGNSGKGMAVTLDALTKRFVDRLLAPERSSIKESQVFLKQELEERLKRLHDSQEVYAAFKNRNRERLPSMESGLIARISSLEQRLSDNRMQLQASEAELGDMRQRLIGTNPVIGRIEEDIMRSTRRLGELRSRYTDEHSSVQGELRTLQRLESEREAVMADTHAIQSADLDRLWNLAASSLAPEDGKAPQLLVSQMTKLQETNSAHLRLKEETAALEKELESLHTAVAETGPVIQEQKRLEESIRLAQESYDAIAKRFDNAQITGALGEFEAPERIKVIEAAADPVVPVTPGNMLFALAGILAGILAGAGLAGAAEVLDTRLRSRNQFENATKVPVIARFVA
ncbi:MAG: hypothetical protein KDJ48_05220 [Nitratireductor sp.]|nr:hypothetical protein [Nitratireductor sp.]